MAVPGGRGAAREAAILQAVLELLAESGYDTLTIDAVAARARCSKATIYRRWPDKAALVITAIRRHATQPADATPDTGSLRTDLQAALQAMRSGLSGQDAALILGLIGAMHRDPELAATVRGQVLQAKREVFGAVIARAAARGDVPSAADGALLAEISSAVLFSRLLVTGEPLDDAFTQHLVDAVLLPALGRPFPDDNAKELPGMWQAIVFGFLGGLMGANGYPHFTRGITKKRYPGALGNGPIPNLVAGWVLLVIAAVLFYFAHVSRHPEWSLGAAAVGVLLMGLFHAGPGAFGRPEPLDAPQR